MQKEDGTDSESHESDSEEDVGEEFRRLNTKGSDADKYLAPLEVEAQLQLLWASSSKPLLSFIWSRCVTDRNFLQRGEEFRMFFVRCVLVPPNRFRPPAVLGGVSSEHVQNKQLSAVIQTNEKISNYNANEGASSSITQLVSLWIELQNAVNCFMDSSKDPNPLGSQAAPPGIRQLLERKEGLFRHHMMGKRVNYCCRSVISPDPYIGTNEIGIPLRFAKVLHYPTPVTPWNAKQLRELVTNGPNEYPGTNRLLSVGERRAGA